MRSALRYGEVLAGDAVSSDGSRATAIDDADVLGLRCSYCKQQSDNKNTVFFHKDDDFVITYSIFEGLLTPVYYHNRF